jgi:hypothetical protein
VRHGVAAVHESVDSHLRDPLANSEIDQREKVLIDCMYSTCTKQPHQVKGAARCSDVGAGVYERPVPEEAAVLNRRRNTNQVLHDDTPCAKVQVADFAIAYLPTGKANPETGCVEKRSRRVPPDRIPRRRPSESYRVAFFFLAISPAIEDNQSDRSRSVSGHICPFGVRVYVRSRAAFPNLAFSFTTAMRTAVLVGLLIAGNTLNAQDSTSHVALKSTPVRTAPTSGSVVTPAVGQLAKGATVEILARDRDWVRVRLEGWVRESDLAITDSTMRPLSAADIRANPEGTKGKLVQWHVEAVALQTADALRSGFQQGEPYLLALGPAPEKTLVYLAVPETLLATARSLQPLAQVTVTARVRNGKSEPAGVPILDLQSLTRR